MWILAAIVLLLIWGNLSRKSASHPLNAVRINPVMPVCSHKSTAGDNFNSGHSFVPGVCEPCNLLRCDANRGCGDFGPTPVHALFPIDPPPPIAIQVPKVVRRMPPVSSVGIKPVIYACDAPPIYGGGGGQKKTLFTL